MTILSRLGDAVDEAFGVKFTQAILYDGAVEKNRTGDCPLPLPDAIKQDGVLFYRTDEVTNIGGGSPFHVFRADAGRPRSDAVHVCDLTGVTE